MKYPTLPRRLLALMLAAVLCLSCAPWAAFAEEGIVPAEVSVPESPAWKDVDSKYDVYQLVTAPAHGDTVVLYNPGNARAVSSADAGYYKAGVEMAVTADTYIASRDETIAWTLSVDEKGVYGFTQGDRKLGVEKSGSYINLKTNAGDYGFVVTPFTEGGDLYRIRSATVENSYGFAYLEWYAGKNAFSAYATDEARADAANFGFRFYKLVREGVAEEQPTEPSVPAEPSEPAVPEEPAGNVAALVTNAASLKAGDQILIAAAGADFALSTNQKSNNRGQAEITRSGDGTTVTFGEDTQIITLEEGLTEDTFAFHVGNGYLYAASSAANHLRTEKTLSGNSSWTVEIADGIATVQATGDSSRNWLRYNAASSLFSCYASGQKDICIYRLGGGAEEEPETPAVNGVEDGDYVIWAPAYNMSLSGVYSGYYNSGVEVALNGETLTGYGNSEIWTVKNHEDGTITIATGSGSKLAMDTGFSSMPLDAAFDTWTLENAGDGLWYVKNVGRDAYIEWYAEKRNWSGYGQIGEGAEGMFALRFTPARRSFETDDSLVEEIARWGGMTHEYNTSFVYGDKYISGDERDTQDIFTAVVSGRTVTPWTKGGSGDAPLYYMGGAGIGSGSRDYLQLVVNAAGWGNMELRFRLRSSNAGPGSFRLQYSADDGKTFHNFTSGTYAYAYTGYGSDGVPYPVTGEGKITDGIAKTSYAPANYVSFVFDVPSGADNCGGLIIRLVPGTERAKGDGAISTTASVRLDSVVLSGSPVVADDLTGFVRVDPDGKEDQAAGSELTMTCATEGAVIRYRINGGNWQTYDELNKPVLQTLPCNLEVYASSEGRADSVVLLYTYAAGTVEAVKFTPNGGGVYISGASEQITLSTATGGADIYFATSLDGVTFGEFARYTAPIVVEKGFGALTVRAYAMKDGYKTSEVVTRTFTERLSEGYRIFFGQLHAHTNISDGTGTVEEAFQYASQVENLDFLAVTDHSNSFDGEGGGVISQDGSKISTEWAQGHAAADAVTDGDFVGLYGYEMTWSNGLGHINTFNTPGWQSRTQGDYKNQSTALQNYYGALATVPESISQFNHPGTSFGDFSDFDHYSESADQLITLIEVGNGEGAIGSSGYFRSYEYYTRALDKGWHLAPTNNQDNHKGLWGDANTGRSVVLADSLTRENIYDALRNYRVYATEDNDLRIYYTLNGRIMGSRLELAEVAEDLSIRVELSDATDASLGRVEVIVNGGACAASGTLDDPSGTVELRVPADYNYYYIRITQPDGDMAVTAPVWVGSVEAVGISGLKAGSRLTIAGEEQTFTAELFNNEPKDLAVESLVFTDKHSGEVLYRDTALTAVPSRGTAQSSFTHTFPADGVYTITATLRGTLDGDPRAYTKDLEVTVMPKTVTSDIIVDGTHFNDYVTGYYGGNMTNMTAIAASQGIRVHVEKQAVTPEMLENCSLLIISAPARKAGTGNAGAYTAKPFEDSFVAMVADYVRSGGSVLLCGLADYQDRAASYGADGHAAVQLNKLLTALGSTMRVNDDEAVDDENNGGQAYRLYPKTFNLESPWCAGIVTGENGQVYSQYSGCTVDPGEGTWLVKGFDTTYSIDSDGDGLGGVGKGEAVFLAVEDSGFGGNIFVSGGVFVSDFEVKAEQDNIWDLPYANRTIYENIIGITRTVPEITPIAQVRESASQTLGRIFAIEGWVTAGTDNENTTFFDAVYIQDSTGGIALFPYSASGLELGTKVRVTGYTDTYQGDIELQIMSLEILDEPQTVIEPEKVSNAEAMNYRERGGQLLQVEGEVTEVVLTSDEKGVARFVLRDGQGDLAQVFIDGYIRSAATGSNTLAQIVKPGNTVSAVGLLYLHPEGDSAESVPVLRVRNCDEVVLIREPVTTDKTQLEQSLQKADQLKEADYSRKSWAALEAARKNARAVLEDEDASQEEIDAAREVLEAAIRGLAPATGRNPETGDDVRIGLCLAVMAFSAGAIVVLITNRRKWIR